MKEILAKIKANLEKNNITVFTAEKATEIFGIHTGNFRKSFQRNIIAVIFRNIQQYIFHGS